MQSARRKNGSAGREPALIFGYHRAIALEADDRQGRCFKDAHRHRSWPLPEGSSETRGPETDAVTAGIQRSARSVQREVLQWFFRTQIYELVFAFCSADPAQGLCRRLPAGPPGTTSIVIPKSATLRTVTGMDFGTMNHTENHPLPMSRSIGKLVR
jgi:hypothetical protein